MAGLSLLSTTPTENRWAPFLPPPVPPPPSCPDSSSGIKLPRCHFCCDSCPNAWNLASRFPTLDQPGLRDRCWAAAGTAAHDQAAAGSARLSPNSLEEKQSHLLRANMPRHGCRISGWLWARRVFPGILGGKKTYALYNLILQIHFAAPPSLPHVPGNLEAIPLHPHATWWAPGEVPWVPD